MILRNCRLIPALTEGFSGPYADVRIEGTRLAALERPGILPPQADELDAAGKTLLPGLIDAHAHLNLYSQNVLDETVESPQTAVLHAYAYAKEYLRQGYTTVRDCGSSWGVASALRDAISAGVLTGPRVISCGRIITPTERGNNWFPLMYREADGVEGTLHACRQEFQGGAEFLKCMATGAFYNEGGVPGQTIVTEEELRIMVTCAARRDSYVAAHCHGAEAIDLAIRCGVRTIEHASFVRDESIAALAERDDCFLIPTIAVDKIPYDEPDSVPKHMWDKINTLTERAHARIRAAYCAGLPLGWGSDLDMENFVRRPGYEFEARREMLGFEPLDMLVQATRNSARALRLEHEIGTVAAGLQADLILVEGRPEENIDVMRRPAAALRAGTVVRL